MGYFDSLDHFKNFRNIFYKVENFPFIDFNRLKVGDFDNNREGKRTRTRMLIRPYLTSRRELAYLVKL